MVSVVNLNDLFLVGFLSALFYLLVQYYKKQKQTYEDINKLHGPPSLPFLGSVHLFLKQTTNAECIETFEGLMEKYPPPMKIRLGPYLFYVGSDPEELETILRHPGAIQKLQQYKVLEKAFGQGLLTATGEKWKKNRRLIEPIFNHAVLKSFVPILVEKSIELVTNLRKHAGRGFFNIETLVRDCTLDISLEFGMGMNKKDVDSKIDYKGLTARYSEIAYTKVFNPAYQHDFIYKWTALSKEENEIIGKGQKFSEEMINNRRIELESKQNEDEGTNKKRAVLLDLLLEKSNMSLEEIRDEITTFVVAGYDTIAFGVNMTLVLLGMFPEIQEKVREETMEVVGPDRNIQHEDLSKLKYLDMVIKESLRMFPASPIVGRQLQDNVTLKTKTLPKGVNVLVPTMYIHRSEKFWPKPLEFIPERFSPEECAKRHPYTFLAFGAGPRNCIGTRLAMVELKTIIATVIRECLIKTTYNSITEISLIPNVIYTLKDGFKCSIELKKKPQNNPLKTIITLK